MQSLAQPTCSGRCQKAPRQAFASRVQPSHVGRQQAAAPVASALSKVKKVEQVARLTEQLKSSLLVYNMNISGIPVKDVETMRHKLPAGSTMICVKNRLMRVAVESLDDEELKTKWDALKGQKGMNAYVFANEEGIRDCAKAYTDLFKELKAKQPEPKKGAPKPPPPTEVRTIVLDGQVIDPARFKTLEEMPTKQELLTKIALGVKANPTKIALALKAMPRKIAYGVKAISELNEDKNMTVAEAVEAKTKESQFSRSWFQTRHTVLTAMIAGLRFLRPMQARCRRQNLL
eukprot:TRINITY_DN3912_c1_g2_i4.p2 TRINITY_DN3912_c1_g2~~TRINITY_DN3912_c1_g2_i4.p2  ORF type:complete len:289 (-),score=36.55 TRINITY_DN3912_c1_g2_i4:83-949(-)